MGVSVSSVRSGGRVLRCIIVTAVLKGKSKSNYYLVR